MLKKIKKTLNLKNIKSFKNIESIKKSNANITLFKIPKTIKTTTSNAKKTTNE